MDALHSCFPEDGKPLMSWVTSTSYQKLHSPDITDFFTSFVLTLSPLPPTSGAGNQFDLIYTRSSLVPRLSVTLLPVSDHHFSQRKPQTLWAIANDILPFLINSSQFSLIPASFKCATIKMLLKKLPLDPAGIPDLQTGISS